MSASDSRRVPREQIDSVVKALYVAADRLDWEHLPASTRTGYYDDWIGDAEIGGVLTRYMSSENARSWIKDGPMKEYGRARLGTGRYAKFGAMPGPAPQLLVTHALGNAATVIAGSVGVKPLHCIASTDKGATYIAWDAARNLRYLVWAAISHLADHPLHAAHIIIMESLESPTTHSDKLRHKRIAERCSINITYYRAAPPRRRTGGEP